MDGDHSYLVNSSEDTTNFEDKWSENINLRMADRNAVEWVNSDETLVSMNLDNSSLEQPQRSFNPPPIVEQPFPDLGDLDILHLSFDKDGFASNNDEIIYVNSDACADFFQLPKNELMDIEEFDGIMPPQIPSSTAKLPSSLPASQNWLGKYGFQVSFRSQEERKTKATTWTYSEAENKLYVARLVPCPINFSTQSSPPANAKIRVTAFYSSPESASERVERCVNHMQGDRANNISDPEHLVRCESPAAHYEKDSFTQHYSVVIPFEDPPIGQEFSTYIFKFVCFGSCSGPSGPNRRPLMLIFSLEKDNICIGRQRVDIKICACPGRDSVTEGRDTVSKKRKIKNEPASPAVSSTEVAGTSYSPPSKKAKITPEESASYNVACEDHKMYEFLLQMKKFYQIMKTMKNLPPPLRNIIDKYNQRNEFDFPDFIAEKK